MDFSAVSQNLNLFMGDILGIVEQTTICVMKGDTMSLDYGSCKGTW